MLSQNVLKSVWVSKLYSLPFSITCLNMNILSVQEHPFLKPFCSSAGKYSATSWSHLLTLLKKCYKQLSWCWCLYKICIITAMQPPKRVMQGKDLVCPKSVTAARKACRRLRNDTWSGSGLVLQFGVVQRIGNPPTENPITWLLHRLQSNVIHRT